jgi:hypothetical protein
MKGVSAPGNTCHPAASRPTTSRPTAVHINLPLHKSHAQFPVGTSKKRPRVTARERAEAMSLRVRMYRMMGLLRCLHTGAPVAFPFLCVLSGKLPYCGSVNWDSVPVHGLCLQPNCEVPITVPKRSTAGVSTLIECRWRCVQHSLFSCKAFPRCCVDSIDLWADLWDLLPLEGLLASACVRGFMWTPLMQTRFPRTACPGSWIFFPAYWAVPAPGVMLCALLLP